MLEVLAVGGIRGYEDRNFNSPGEAIPLWRSSRGELMVGPLTR
jgi:hypothetical protein